MKPAIEAIPKLRQVSLCILGAKAPKCTFDTAPNPLTQRNSGAAHRRAASMTPGALSQPTSVTTRKHDSLSLTLDATCLATGIVRFIERTLPGFA